MRSQRPDLVFLLQLQLTVSFRFRRASVSEPLSSSSASSKTGSDTTYVSLAHAPKSSRRQRSLQSGKSLWRSESVAVLQMGQRCFIARSLTQNAQRGSSGNTVEPFVCRRLALRIAVLRARQDFDYASDQIVRIG